MNTTITVQFTEQEAESLEKVIDETLTVLRRLEKESPEREARIAKSQAEIQEIKREIKEQMTAFSEKSKQLDAV